jgi:hypothetical protein
MNVEVHLLSQSQPIVYTNVINAYTKDGLYCIRTKEGVTEKYPFVNIFRIKEWSII